ncbi:hypothetical protein [Streptomyces sp. NPDC056817]|uniref:hypothetical protein n=1 Tax=Streptomyces sp. NPDC056817 TaxID=3345950 RepID=UPI003693F278
MHEIHSLKRRAAKATRPVPIPSVLVRMLREHIRHFGVALLARRPYDLRNAAVSLWLNSGVPAAEVAEMAGHSVAILMDTYYKCIHGQREQMVQRIIDALSDDREGGASGEVD